MSNEEMVARIRQGESKYAEQLYTQNLPLIRKFIIPYVGNKDELEDCLQEAYFGLTDAVYRYDNSQNVKFMTFARWYIVRTVQNYLYNSTLIRLPQYLYEKMLRYKKTVAAISQNGEKPTKKAIEKISGISQKEQDTIINFMQGTKSLDEKLETAEGDRASMMDMLPSEENVEENTVDTLYRNNMQTDLWKAVHENLSEREEFVTVQSVLYNASLRQIAERTNTTHERVRQVKAAALRKLRIRCKRLLEGYAEAEGLLYHSGFNTFVNRQESVVERIAERQLTIEEKYYNMLKEERYCHERRLAKCQR